MVFFPASPDRTLRRTRRQVVAQLQRGQSGVGVFHQRLPPDGADLGRRQQQRPSARLPSSMNRPDHSFAAKLFIHPEPVPQPARRGAPLFLK